MLEYILIIVLNILILLLLFKRDDLFSFFLTEKNDQSTIKADKLSGFLSVIGIILISFLSVLKFSTELVYTIGLLFVSEYIPNNHWTNLFILATTGAVFYKAYKKQDDKEGPRAITTFLCLVALLIGYDKLDRVFTGIATFLSFVYLLFNMVDLKNGFPIISVVSFVAFLITIVVGLLYKKTSGLQVASVLSLSLVSLSSHTTHPVHFARRDGA